MAGLTLLIKMACLIIVSMAVVAPHAQASVTCGQVVQALVPCLGYLKSGGGVQPVCCNGVRSLNSAARTTSDRQQACACIKQAAQAYAINYSFGSALPGRCGVSIGMPISASTDCSRVL